MLNTLTNDESISRTSILLRNNWTLFLVYFEYDSSFKRVQLLVI